MPAGEGFSSGQLHDIDTAVRAAETMSRREFSVYVGPVPDGQDAAGYARRLHAALIAPAISVLVLVDPVEHRLEIVTGTVVRNEVTDAEAARAAATMGSAFAAGDLVGGIKLGLAELGEAAARTA